MKTCFKCSRTLPLSEFYRHPRMGDGHLGKCKDCAKADVAEAYRIKVSTPQGLAQERQRSREKYYRLGYAEKYRGNSRRYQASYNARNPEKAKARQIFGNAVRDGKLVRPDTCQECGAGGVIHGHHRDYSKPLEVMWLCVPCHGLQHRKKAA
jgi:hypothetical protein